MYHIKFPVESWQVKERIRKNKPESETVLNTTDKEEMVSLATKAYWKFQTKVQRGTKYLIKIYSRRRNLCQFKVTRICIVYLNVIAEN